MNKRERERESRKGKERDKEENQILLLNKQNIHDINNNNKE